MKKLGILLTVLLLSMTWQTGTDSAVGSGETRVTAEFAPQSALVQSAAGAWTIVEFSSYPGHFTSIAVDSNDLAHISHVDNGKLLYTRQYRMGNDIWWGTQTVVGASDIEGASLTLDENDRPYIVYYDAVAQNLCWAWSPTDNVWNIGTRNTAGTIDGGKPSAVMREGGLHVAYLNFTAHSVEYIQITPGGGWPPTPQTVGGSVSLAADVRLALRSDGLPRISYATANNKLMYAIYTGSAWGLVELDGDVEHPMGACNSLALNADNQARIAYYDATHQAQALRYKAYGLIGWGAATIVDDNLGAICYISLAVDGEGDSHILYYDGHQNPGDISGSLLYAQRNGSGWSFETVDGPAHSCGFHSAFALDSQDRPHASYYCGHLRYAYRAFPVYLPAIMRGQ